MISWDGGQKYLFAPPQTKKLLNYDEVLGDYFTTNITTIRQNLDLNIDLPTPSHHPTLSAQHTLSSFFIMTEASLRKLIASMQSKSCTLDPLPTFLLKDPSVCDALLPSMLKQIERRCLITPSLST
jgi:hypothetical protein